MITNNDSDLDQLDDDLLQISDLRDLSKELIEECIKDQIKNPFFSRTDYLEPFADSYIQETDMTYEDVEAMAELNDAALSFYHQVLMLLNDKFELDLDLNTVFELDVENVKNFTEGLYEFFILNYSDNIATYITNLILESKNAIVDEISSMTNGKDITSLIYKDKISDKTYSVLLANINKAIKSVNGIELFPDDFIELFDDDLFSTAMVKYGIDNMLINGDFVKKFVEPLFGQSQDSTYDSIALTVQQNLYSAYLREHPEKDEGEN